MWGQVHISLSRVHTLMDSHSSQYTCNSASCMCQYTWPTWASRGSVFTWCVSSPSVRHTLLHNYCISSLHMHMEALVKWSVAHSKAPAQAFSKRIYSMPMAGGPCASATSQFCVPLTTLFACLCANMLRHHLQPSPRSRNDTCNNSVPDHYMWSASF